MNDRTQLKSWLFSGAFIGTLSLAHGAMAAGGLAPLDASPPPPRTTALVVKGSPRINADSAPLRDTVPAPGPSAFLLQPPAPERLILGMRLPAFIALGLGGLGAGGAIATGVVVSNRGNDPRSCDARCADRTFTDRTLLVTTGVLSGIAAVGVGLGVAFILGTPSRTERLRLTSPRPTLGFGFSAQKAVAKVGWRF